jgi:GNAT superfamily N-acetyltransferase
MSSEFVIRQLQQSEISPAVAAEISILASQLRGTPSSVGVTALRQIVSNNYFVIAEAPDANGTKIVGMACLVVMYLPQGVRLLAESVVVHLAFRQRGIGSGLIGELIAKAASYRDAGAINLTCNHKRVEALAFYTGLGFKLAETSVLRRPINSGLPK